MPSRKKNQMTGAILSMKTRTDAQWPILQLYGSVPLSFWGGGGGGGVENTRRRGGRVKTQS